MIFHTLTLTLTTWFFLVTATWAHYIGITDCIEHGVWRYYGNNETATFFDFKGTEGNSNAECCCLFYEGHAQQWADYPCTSTHTFPTVCEIEY